MGSHFAWASKLKAQAPGNRGLPFLSASPSCSRRRPSCARRPSLRGRPPCAPPLLRAPPLPVRPPSLRAAPPCARRPAGRRPQHEAPPATPSPPTAVAAYHRAVSHRAVAVVPPSSPRTDPRRRPVPSPAAGGLPVRRRLPRRRRDVVHSSHRIPVVLLILPLPAFLVGKIYHLLPRPTLSAPQRCACSSTRPRNIR